MDLLTEIKRIIKEEYGISDVVNLETRKIINTIKAYHPKKAKQIVNGFPLSEGKISDYKFLNFTIDLYFRIYYITDISEITLINDINPGNTDFDKNAQKYFIQTTVICNNGNFTDYNGTTEHEVDHLFKIKKTDKMLLVKPINQEIYQKARNMAIRSDFYSQIIGYVIYYNNNFERDAFASEMYRIIMDNPHTEPIETIKKNVTYKNIKIINTFIENITAKDESKIENILLNNFGKHYQWWYSMSKNVVKNYYTKIGKIIVKAEKDLIKKYPMSNFKKQIVNPPTKD